MASISTSSRIRGSLYGVAIVDALGGPVEFHQRGTFPQVTGYLFNGNFDIPPGTWTDDTSMTLCLAQSLVDREGKFVVHDQVRKYVRWKVEGYMSAIGRCFDIGNATRQSLQIWRKSTISGKDASAVEMQRCQTLIDQSLNRKAFCGNGSLMRCAPIPLVYHHCPNLAQSYAAQASSPTHPHLRCLQACQLYTHIIIQAMNSTEGYSKNDLWISLHNFLGGPEGGFGAGGSVDPAIWDALGKYGSLAEFQELKEEHIRSSGYVVHTLQAALWSFLTTETFQDGALKVVNLGDDADTVGAVYGGLAGAWYGVEAIPKIWMDRLAAKSTVDGVVEGVVRLVEKGGYAPV